MSNPNPIKQTFAAKALRVNSDSFSNALPAKHVKIFGKFAERERAPGEATSCIRNTFTTGGNKYTTGFGDPYKYNGRGVAA